MKRFAPVALVIILSLALSALSVGASIEKEIERYRARINKDPTNLELHRRMISEYKARGLIEVPLRVYEAARERYPDNPLVGYALGLAYLMSGDEGKAEEARRLLEDAASAFKNSPWAKLALAEALAATGEGERAVSIWKELLDEMEDPEPVYVDLVNYFLKIRDYDSALFYSSEMTGRDPESPTAHYLKGLVHYSMADLKSARKEFEEAIRLNYRLGAAYYKLGQIYAAEGKPEEAVRMYKLGRRYDPRNAEARYELAAIFMDKDQEKYAVAAIRSALAVDPENSKYVSMLKGADYERAVEVLKEYLSSNPDDHAARFILGKLQLKLGRAEEAKRELEVAAANLSETSPVKKDVHVELGRIYERENPERAAEQFEQAAELGAVEVEVLRKALETYRGKDDEKFVETAEKLLNLIENPKLEFEVALTYEKLAEEAKKRGDEKAYEKLIKKAVDHCSNAVRMDNANLEYNLKLVDMLAQDAESLKPYKMKAFRILSDMIDLYPDNPDLYYQRAKFMLSFGVGDRSALIYDMADIIADLERAVQLNPDHAGAHHLLGVAYDREGDVERAMAEFEKALQLDPDDLEAMIYLARRYSEMGRMDEALDLYERALQIDPENLEVIKDYSYLALKFDDRNRLAAVHEALGRAVKLAPNDPLILMNYGYTLYLLGAVEKAIDYYLKAIDLDPSSVIARYNLALAYEAIGKADKAREVWREILRLDPNGRYGAEARRRLGK